MVTKPTKTLSKGAMGSGFLRAEQDMRKVWGLAGAALLLSGSMGLADTAPRLALHRAGYQISLDGIDSEHGINADAPVAASGLIAYEFRGSACEGYASNFRQLTELQREEGDPISSDIRSLTFEDAEGKSIKFQIDSTTAGNEHAPAAGSAAPGDSGAI